jgi:hypothetical protein
VSINVEELKERLLRDLDERGLEYALGTLRHVHARQSLPVNTYVELKIWLINEFLRRKNVRIEDWKDEDIKGVEIILGDNDIPFDLRLEVFKALLGFYGKAREEIGRIVNTLSPGTVASKVIKGLIVLMENFERFAEVKRPEELTFPSLIPPEPRPKEDLLNEIISVLEKSRDEAFSCIRIQKLSLPHPQLWVG